MGFIYEAKEIAPDLPRIEIRITEDHDKTLAYAFLKKNIIRVSFRAITDDAFDLRTIVFHEILHAVYGIKHDEGCLLMRAVHSPLSRATATRLFKSYVKRSVA